MRTQKAAKPAVDLGRNEGVLEGNHGARGTDARPNGLSDRPYGRINFDYRSDEKGNVFFADPLQRNAMAHIAPNFGTPCCGPRATRSSAVGPCHRPMRKKTQVSPWNSGKGAASILLLPHCFSMHTPSPTRISIHFVEPHVLLFLQHVVDDLANQFKGERLYTWPVTMLRFQRPQVYE